MSSECDRLLRAFMILTIAAAGSNQAPARSARAVGPISGTRMSVGGGMRPSVRAGRARTVDLVLPVLEDALGRLLVLLLGLTHLDRVDLDAEELPREAPEATDASARAEPAGGRAAARARGSLGAPAV